MIKHKKERKKVKWLSLIASLMLIISMPTMLYVNYVLVSQYPQERDVKFHYINITDEQTILIKIWMSEVDENYLRAQKAVYFVNNISNYCDDCLAVNIEGNNYIPFMENKTEFQETVCHELLHTYIYHTSNNRYDVAHWIVYDLGEKRVCLKNEYLKDESD